MADKQFFYGGQALIEGVMIRGQRAYSVAARRPTGEICALSRPLPSLYRGVWRQVPFLRGTLVLLETLIIGMRALTFSAQVAAGEEEEDAIPAWAMALTIAVSLALGVGLFFVAPLLAVEAGVDRFTDSSILSNLAEGVLRLAIFIAYIVLIGLVPNIRRVFAYHAAEHMTVHAHESRVPLDPEHVRRFPAAHPRCGTAFLLVVMVVAIVVFAFLGKPPLEWRMLSRIVLLPVIAGISYEAIRLSGSHFGNALLRLIMAPSLALQALTTRPPDDGQIEVAIAAMQSALDADRGAAPGPSPEPPQRALEG